MAWKVTTDPLAEPVTLAEAKEHLNFDSDSANATISAMIGAARRKVEELEWRSLITQTVTLKLDAFPAASAAVYLPRPPLQSITSIQYVDADGETQTLAAADYDVDVTSEPGRVKPSYGNTWPVTRSQMNAVTIVYAAGYGGDRADVPGDTRAAIKMLVAHLWANREATTTGVVATAIPMGVEFLLRRVNAERVLASV